MLFKVATWNVNSLRVRLPQVLQWLADTQPDVLALQETKVEDKDFPLAAVQEAGYHVVYAGQKTYNGVALLSKSVPQACATDMPNWADPQRRFLAATIAGVRIINLYVPNGNQVDSDKYQYKLQWLQHLLGYLQQALQDYPRVLVVGDFNIAPADADVHDPRAWQGQVLVSEPERAALQAVLNAGFSDCFRQFTQEEGSYSWWDYRLAGFQRNHGLRIDLILANSSLSRLCTQCLIDKQPRGWERPSDHAPVVSGYRLDEPA
jgi:exodeoxyribonuclease III